jgi:hypothetical protein
MALKWFTYFCSEVEFVLKVDHDTFINTPNLLKLTETIMHSSKDSKPSNIMFCRLAIDFGPVRNPKSKWFLSEQEYPEKTFPRYCMGYFVFFSSDVVTKLYDVGQHLPYLPIDDMQITGIARSKINVTISTNASLTINRDRTYEILNGTRIDNDFVVAGENLCGSNIKKLWKIVNI